MRHLFACHHLRRSLNFAYKGGLRSANVEYINGLAKFEDPHTLSWQGKKKSGTITAANILIAVGGRPHIPADVPGAAEYVPTTSSHSLTPLLVASSAAKSDRICIFSKRTLV